MNSPRLIVQEAFHGPKYERVKVSTASGGKIRVGQGGDLELHPPDVATRFELAWDGKRCRIEFSADVTPPRVHGRPAVSGQDIQHGGWIRAGSGDWLVHEESLSPGAEHLADAEAEAEAVCARLHGSIGSLYAVVDVSQLPRARSLLCESVERCSSLFSGAQADRMIDTAPQLVRFEPDSGLLRRLVYQGWRTRWGVFVRSTRPMSELRDRLREVLFVRPPQGGQTLLFRFYDPMILGQYAEARRRRPCPGLFSGLPMMWIDGGGRLLELKEDDA